MTLLLISIYILSIFLFVVLILEHSKRGSYYRWEGNCEGIIIFHMMFPVLNSIMVVVMFIELLPKFNYKKFLRP